MRIRTVKPGMWTDGRVVRLSDAANLLFISLLNQADDEGRLKNDPKEIECHAPRFWERSKELIKELVDASLLNVYGISDEFLEIPNFGKHQVIDRPRSSEIPSSNIRRTFSEQSTQGKEGKGRERKGRERNGKEITDRAAKFQKPTPQEVCDYAKSIGYDLDGGRFCDYYESRGWLIGKTRMKNWRAAVRTWRRNDQDSVRNRSQLSGLAVKEMP